jgi:hypothetical protein
MPILRIFCCNGSLIIWMVVSLTTAKFKSLIFSMSGFYLSYTRACSVSWFCMTSACFLTFFYIKVYIGKAGNCAQIAEWFTPWKNSNGVQKLVSDWLVLLVLVILPREEPNGKHHLPQLLYCCMTSLSARNHREHPSQRYYHWLKLRRCLLCHNLLMDLSSD